MPKSENTPSGLKPDINPRPQIRNINYSGLMPHYQPGHGFPNSRDWVLDDFNCRAKSCIANKDGKCIIPSLCIIGEDGRCTNFRKE